MLNNIELKNIPKFVLGHEIINHREKISMLKDLIILLWGKVEEISTVAGGFEAGSRKKKKKIVQNEQIINDVVNYLLKNEG